MIIYDDGEVKVEVEETARITVVGAKPIYLTRHELAAVGRAIAAHTAEFLEGVEYYKTTQYRDKWAF